MKQFLHFVEHHSVQNH